MAQRPYTETPSFKGRILQLLYSEGAIRLSPFPEQKTEDRLLMWSIEIRPTIVIEILGCLPE